jgi:hypothetical protein
METRMLPDQYADELHQSARESRLVSSLFKLNEKLHDLSSAAPEEEFEQWQSAWTKQSKRIEEQLRLIQRQLEKSDLSAPNLTFSVVGLADQND